MRKNILLVVIQVFIAVVSNAQVNTSRPEAPLQYPENIKEFYQLNKYNYVWLNNPVNTKNLLQVLNQHYRTYTCTCVVPYCLDRFRRHSTIQ